MTYTLTGGPGVVRDGDRARIPDDPGNADWQLYQAWLAAGNTPTPYTPPAAPAPSFLARDLLAQLTVDDYAAITSAIASNAALGLLWASLLAQGEQPISTGSARFTPGWAGLAAAIGATRAKVVAAALGISAS
jgi:hypothetical protein